MKSLVDNANLSSRFFIDSAGTGAYHVGEQADRRSAEAARRQGVELTSLARQFTREDFDAFDYIVAMDSRNLAHLKRLARSPADSLKLSLLRSFDPDADASDVPDPYYQNNFDAVFQICRRGCEGLLAHILQQRGA